MSPNLPYLLLFVSGACALVYEVLWSRYLALFLGSTALAHTLVLALFLGGLSLGSALLGRVADRFPARLRLYGWLELGIALWCGLYPHLHRGLDAAYFSLVTLDTPPAAAAALQLLLAAFALLPPAVLMGGTVPVLTRALAREPGQVERAVSRLYAANTFGAVAGALAAGLFMVGTLGLDASMMFASMWNALVGAAALALSRSAGESAAREDGPDAAARDASPLRRAVLAAAFVSGFCALAYELAWTRYFALVLGSSTYAFSLMLAAFLTGLAAGGWAAGRGRRDAAGDARLFAQAQAAIALTLLATLPFYDRLPWEFGRLSGAFQDAGAPFALFQAASFAVCFLLMAVPTFFSGLSLPLAARLASTRGGAVGGEVGTVFAVNTLGTIAGAGTAGLLLLPALGIERTFLAAAALSLLNGAGFWAFASRGDARRRFGPLAAAGVAFALFTVLVPRWDVLALNIGAFRRSARGTMPDWQALKGYLSATKPLFYRDGSDATVLVQERHGAVQLLVNGKADASSGDDLATQVLLAQLPLSLAPRAEGRPLRVLVIGLGSGITAGSALTHPGAQVDVVEISPEVAEGARHFAPWNRGALDDPRLRLHVTDAKTFLRLTRTKYDVIVSEPSNPWVAGMGGLFSEEHFAAASRALAPGGLMVQWFHVYEMDDPLVRMILRTFLASFPHASVWNMDSADVLVMGSVEPLPEDFRALARRIAVPEVAADLGRVGLRNAAALLSLEVLEGLPLALAAGEGPLNSDYFPDLEFSAPAAFYANRNAEFFRTFDAHRWTKPADRRTMLARYLGGRALRLPELQSMADRYGDVRRANGAVNPNYISSVLHEARRLGPEGRAWARPRLMQHYLAAGNLEAALAEYAGAGSVEEASAYADALYRSLRTRASLWHRPDASRLAALLEDLARREPARADVHLHRLAQLRFDLGEPGPASAAWERALAAQQRSGRQNVPAAVLKARIDEAVARLEGGL